LSFELRLRLLKLTRDGGQADLRELAEQLGPGTNNLTEIANLRERGLVSTTQGIVKLDTSQRMTIAEQLVQEGLDPRRVSRFLKWQEFEDFAAHSFEENGFRTSKHLVFKIKAGRREIDLLAWNDIFLLVVDCKRWIRGLSASRLRLAAQAQIERAAALADRLDLLSRQGVQHLDKRAILPLVFTLGNPRESFVNGVPIVSVSKIATFLFGISPYDDRLRSIPVKHDPRQSFLRVSLNAR